MDKKRYEAGNALLEAAQKFWSACHDERQHGAVQWLRGTDGALVIYTRGEYVAQLLENIERLRWTEKVHVFAEYLQLDPDAKD